MSTLVIFPRPRGCSQLGGRLRLKGQRLDLFLQRKQNGLTVLEQLSDPLGRAQRGKSALFPPLLHRLQSVVDH